MYGTDCFLLQCSIRNFISQPLIPFDEDKIIGCFVRLAIVCNYNAGTKDVKKVSKCYATGKEWTIVFCKSILSFYFKCYKVICYVAI